MKKIILCTLVGISILACTDNSKGPVSSAEAEMTQDQFNQFMEKFLNQDSNQDKIGKAVQGYFERQQKKAMQAEEAKEKVGFEEQFKTPVKVDVGASPAKGPANAKVTIIEFSDFQCPFCTRGAKTMEDVMKAYPNDVKLVFKNLPLPFHDEAKPAALAALAAGKQGKFWEMHDILFAKQKELAADKYEVWAKELGLDVTKFKADMASKELVDQVAADEKQAEELGIQGTPGFVVNGVMVKGAYPVAHFKKVIDRWLSADPTKPEPAAK